LNRGPLSKQVFVFRPLDLHMVSSGSEVAALIVWLTKNPYDRPRDTKRSDIVLSDDPVASRNRVSKVSGYVQQCSEEEKVSPEAKLELVQEGWTFYPTALRDRNGPVDH
jgi:hypothetical protein